MNRFQSLLFSLKDDEKKQSNLKHKYTRTYILHMECIYTIYYLVELADFYMYVL